MVFQTEKNIQNYLLGKKESVLSAVIIIIAIIIRFIGRDFESGDMHRFLIPWFIEIKQAGGISSLSEQVGDYGLLYQTLIAIMTSTPLKAIYLYKLLSVSFDFLLACAVYRIMRDGYSVGSKHIISPAIVAGGILLLPTTIINSAFWGQCDSMYTFFCLATLYYLSKDRFTLAFIFYGLAIACKLQSVFILPFILFYYLKRQNFTLLYFLITIIVIWLTGTVAFIEGRSLFAPIEIYHNQTFEYQSMYLNFPSFWVIAGNDYVSLKVFSVLTTGIICLFGGYAYLTDIRFDNRNGFYEIATWFVWSIVLFLPSMHERYAYLLDVMLAMISFYDKRHIKFAVIAVCTSLFLYGNYLFERERDVPLLWLSVIYLSAYLMFSYNLFFRKRKAGTSIQSC